jgi:hypothetical protein
MRVFVIAANRKAPARRSPASYCRCSRCSGGGARSATLRCDLSLRCAHPVRRRTVTPLGGMLEWSGRTVSFATAG